MNVFKVSIASKLSDTMMKQVFPFEEIFRG